MASPALRRKQVRAAELVGTTLTYAEAGAVVGRSERTVARWLEDPDLRAIADREGALPGDVGPAEILHGALWATKANGQPDWPTRPMVWPRPTYVPAPTRIADRWLYVVHIPLPLSSQI